MSNESLRETLNDIAQELIKKKRQSETALSERDTKVRDLDTDLQDAKAQEAQAVIEDKQAAEKYSTFNDYLNSLTEKPSALCNKLESLKIARSESIRKCQTAAESVKIAEMVLHKEELLLKRAQEDLETTKTQLQEAYDHIRKVSEGN